jgi:hypothetical protein
MKLLVSVLRNTMEGYIAVWYGVMASKQANMILQSLQVVKVEKGVVINTGDEVVVQRPKQLSRKKWREGVDQLLTQTCSD